MSNLNREVTEQDWTGDSSSSSDAASKKSMRGFGMSQSIANRRMGSTDGSTFNGSFGNANNASALPSTQFNTSMVKNNEQFKVPQLKPKDFGLSQSRFCQLKPSDDAMEIDRASSFSSSIGDSVPSARFKSSFSNREFGNSFGGSANASVNKFSSPFNKGNFGNSADASRFKRSSDNIYDQPSFVTATSFNVSFGSTGSRRTANGYGNKFSSSKGSLSRSFRSNTDCGLLNKSFDDANKSGPSLSSFGQMKPDFLSYESAQRKFQTSRNSQNSRNR